MIELPIIISALILLLALDLVTIAARISFLQTSNARLLSIRDGMGGAATRTVALLAKLPRLRASLNITLVLTRFSLAGLAIFGAIQGSLLNPTLVAALAFVILALITFWLEWVTETAVFSNAEIWALRLTPFVRILMFCTWPLLLPLILMRDQDGPETAILVTEDELKSLVDAGQEEGVLELGERQMIYSIFQLGETLAREIMVPRIDMVALEVDTPLSEAVDALLQSGFSRVPIFEETVDNTLGLLYAKDLLRAWREGEKLGNLRDLLRQAYFVPEAKKVDKLLAEIQKRRIHMAIVVDEYGGVAGLVTLEDIVEEILGEIQDEYDQGEEAPYQEQKDGSYLFQGRIDLDDFNEIMHSNLPSDEADTLGGYIYGRLGRVPSVGESVKEGSLLLKVEQVSARRIRTVSACWLPPGIQEEVEDRVY